MEFKAGDRVHVTRFESNDVDFYATLTDADLDIWELVNCTDFQYEGLAIYKEIENKFGIDKEDYYTLATDEEDTEEPVIQRTTDTHDPVNKPSHYMLGDIEVKDIIAIVADKYHKGSVAHNVASALEYQMRAPAKNGLEDIKKARKCLDFAIENWE
ncbi:DUF3310 domain-containing protein [Mammaliicoccus sciuri]|uniref:DUF3310 domain-containing protein n=1 Tax=Mammaliicoccus sciuri TaxID=1296 RepID=UPI001C3E577F|nr:DUF3310 domain-containing protein [Mammaliicoccus sciuri]MBV5103417.1 DUF3310 domain-containing protein [Mammaliicoccus sciuri]